MKTWKTVFIVFGIFLVLSVISGMAYLCNPKENAPDMQSDEARHASAVGQCETQQAVINSKSQISNTTLEKEDFAQKTRKLQMPFIANNGQVDERVEFYAKTFGGTVFVTKDGEIVYALPKTEKSECRLGEAERTQQAANPQSKNPSNPPNPKSAIQNLKSGVALREEFVGARVKTIQGEDPSVTKVNYFKGNDPSKWKTNVSTYDIVSLGDIYDGIELKLKAYGNNVEKLFCVKPKSNPDQIKVQLSGAKSITVNEEGQLAVETELGPVKFTKPIAYQEIDGKRVEVAVEYRIQDVGWVKSVLSFVEGRSAPNPPPTPDSGGQPSVPLTEGDEGGGFALLNPSCLCALIQDNRASSIVHPASWIVDHAVNSQLPNSQTPQLIYGFTVASYDRTKDLIIDPLLASTYLGGISYNRGNSLALDTSGNVYVTGYTSSFNFPTTSGAYDTSYSGGVYADVFVSKLDSELTSLLASTFLGGGDYDWGYSLALDASGNVYVTGYTKSYEFPTTSGAYDTSYNGDWDDPYYDVFVSKLDGGLTSLLASTFLGGSDHDYGYSLTLDTSGNVYVTGEAYSKDFPTTSGAYDTSYNTGYGADVFVSKLDGGLTSLLASTYLGGSNTDVGNSLTLDTSGNVYVTGYTESANFPTTSGAYDTSNNTGYSGYGADVFISKLDGGLTSLLASTYLGGSYWDEGQSLALDTSGHVYVTGDTSSSTDFPTTSGAYDTSFNGNDYWTVDVFVSKLDGGLTSLLSSTYLGGSGSDYSNSLALDTSGNVYVTGDASSDFPTTSGAYDSSIGNAFVSKLNGELTSLLSSTYLGGSSSNYCRSLALDTSGNIYVTGYTKSSDFPTTSGAYDTSLDGDFDAFVSKLDSNLSASATTPTPTPTSGCEVSEIMLSENKLTLNVGTSKGVIVKLTGKDGCIPDGVTIKTEINTAGRKRISVSPESAEANDSGETTFIITAKKKGSALLTFKSDGMKKKLMVKVKK